MDKLKLSLLLPFCNNLCIVLNLYNGDIFKIESNKEYLLWYIPHLVLFLFFTYKNNTNKYLLEISILLLSIIINIYWIYAWKHDERTNYRHRTEFYDSQSFICSMIFVSLYNTINNHILENENENENKNKLNYNQNIHISTI